MKKTLISALGILLLANPLTASAQFIFFTNQNETITIYEVYSVTDTNGAVVVPDKIGERPVASVLLFGSQNNWRGVPITSISIPGSVTNLGQNAFALCTSLTNISVDLSNPSYSSIGGILYDKGQRTFLRYPSGLAGDCSIPSGVTNIGTRAFQLCSNLTSVSIPDGVVSIPDSAFSMCVRMQAVSIPTNLANIGKSAFNGCGALTNVMIPNSVTNIGDRAFASCTRLTNIAVSASTIGSGAFTSCSNLTSLRIPQGTTYINSWLCQSCVNLTNVDIPESVTNIGFAAFVGCRRLSNVTLSTNITQIGDSAFSGCGLTNVAVPDSITTIPRYLFSACGNLTNVTLPSKVGIIDVGAFSYCSNLTSLNLSNIHMIGGDAFAYSGLTSVTLPSIVDSIAPGLFQGCIQLTNVALPFWATVIGDSAFAGSGIDRIEIPPLVSTIERYAFTRSRLTSVTIPGRVSTIGYNAFGMCPYLTNITVDASNGYYGSAGGALFNKDKSVLIQCPGGLLSYTIPSGVVKIGARAFEACFVTNVVIPDTVAEIGAYAFYYCDGLSSLTIPSSVKTLGDEAICRCSNLQAIHFQGDAPSLSTSYFGYGCSGGTVHYLPGAQGWKERLGSIPTAMWSADIKSGNFGHRPEGFGFDITGATNQMVVVEACTNLSNSAWVPVSTNILVGGSFRFSDPKWAENPNCFYRFRAP